jgi:hypothetical protein
MDALRKSVGGTAAEPKAAKKGTKELRKEAAGQKRDADADGGQEIKGSGRQKAGGQAAAKVEVFSELLLVLQR